MIKISTSSNSINDQEKNTGKTDELPNTLVINNILNFSKSLKVIPSKLVNEIKIMLN